MESSLVDRSAGNSSTKKRKWSHDADGKHPHSSKNNKKKNARKDASSSSSRLGRKHEATRRKLPVYSFRKQIVQLVRDNSVLLVVAETGSGKSTQIPAYLHDSGILNHRKSKQTGLSRKICVTQPRRVAAITVAKRVAEELGCVAGTLVGHRVRFDDCSDHKGPNSTRLLYATDGMLLREATSDPLLTKYSAVVLDEAHERSLQTDILFGVVKRAMRARDNNATTAAVYEKEEKGGPETTDDSSSETKDQVISRRMKRRAQKLGLPPLKVVVMSATLDIDTFQQFFTNPQIIKIPGRQFPVQILYTREPQEDYVDAALSTVLQIVTSDSEEGDILVFLTGQEEIEDLAVLLKKHLEESDEVARHMANTSTAGMENGTNKNGDLVESIRGIGTNLFAGGHSSIVCGIQISMLYAALPPEAQMYVFQPKPKGCSRKVVLSTNIAETSVTLDGIRYVVDCGKHKSRNFSGATGMESLSIEDVSKAQAAQRTGRAGRVAEGICFRLYTEDAFDSLQEASTPEILRVNLAQVILQLKGMGIHDPQTFDFLTPPRTQTLKKAFDLLFALGAIDANMDLTEYGKKLARLPLDPVFAHLLMQSVKYGCVSEMLTAVSMLSTDNIFYRPGGGGGAAVETSSSDGGSSAAARAAAAHRRFASHEGDLPTLLAVYQAWKREAVYSKKKQKEAPRGSNGGAGKLLHGEWCTRNFVNGRALRRAHDIRLQLADICARDLDKNGLAMDVTASCGADMEIFLKCACAGLFLQAASRIVSSENLNPAEMRKSGRSGILFSSRGRYKTKIGGAEVSIHPTSSMFGRNPAPKCVVYTELLVTKKTYIRGVTQVREEWLAEVAPNFFKPT